MKKRRGLFVALFSILLVSLAFVFLQKGCSQAITPKPYGYFRIDLPKREYRLFDSKCPVSFDVPTYSRLELFKDRESEDSCWFNITFPKQNAKIYCTYLPVHGNIDALIRDSYEFAAKHEMKASALKRTSIAYPEKSVYGILYEIQGEAASQIQFFVTDSTAHFFRGSLYFENRPNADSIAPVLSFLHDDILQITSTLHWR